MYMNKIIMYFNGIETKAYHYEDRIETEHGHIFKSLSDMYNIYRQPIDEKNVEQLLKMTNGVSRHEIIALLQMNEGEIFNALVDILKKYGKKSINK